MSESEERRNQEQQVRESRLADMARRTARRELKLEAVLDTTRHPPAASKERVEVAERPDGLELTADRGELLSESVEGKQVMLRNPASREPKPPTRRQVESAERAGQLPQIFYVNQVVSLIEHDLLDTSNARVLDRLQHLRRLLNEHDWQ